MHSKLPMIENICYFLITVSFMLKMLYEVYLGSNTYVYYLVGEEQVVPGFSWLNRLQDRYDYEWLTFIIFMKTFAPLIVLHLFFTCCIKNVYPNALPLWYSFISILYLCFYFSPGVCCFLLVQTMAVYVLFYFNLTFAVWALGLCYILIDHSPFPNIPNSQQLMITFIISWNSLKYIDFVSCERSGRRNCKTFFNYLAYVFYFPTLIFGPFTPYNSFIKSFDRNAERPLFERTYSLITSLFRFFMWFILTELSQHYFYSSAMTHNINMNLFGNSWFLNGIALCIANFFYLKYLVIYGSLGSISKFEGVEAPPPPRCVNYVHLYSNMWRHFDRGFYLFVVKNIYFPLLGVLGCSFPCKMLSSFLTFSFVFIWHGTSYDIFLWAALNFIVITLEAVGKNVGLILVNSYLRKVFSPQGVRRLACAVISPVWLISIGSNTIFVGSQEYGFMFLTQFVGNGWRVPFLCWLFGYCFSQVAEEIEQYRTDSKGNTRDNVHAKSI